MALSRRPVALVLRALGLGDLLTAVPALRAIRAALPEHRLVLATSGWLAPLVDLADVADTIHPTGELEPLGWTGEVPETAVNLHGRGPRSHRVLLDTRPRRVVAFGCPQVGVAGPVWRSDEHEVRRWCRLVEAGLAAPADPRDLFLRRPDTAPTVAGAVVLHVGAAFRSRQWPVERFAEVASRLADDGSSVVLTGSSAERGSAERAARLARLPEGAVLAGRTSLDGLAALVAHARLVVCGDTGVAHLATAYATPSVLLFGPTPPTWWGPPRRRHHVVLWHGRGSGDPWGASPDRALLAIEPAEVVAAARGLLAAAAGSRRAGSRTGGQRS